MSNSRNEKDAALLQLQLQQGRASLQQAATLGANLQTMAAGPGVASMPAAASATVQPYLAAAQDRHVFRNTAKPGYTPDGPQPGAFSQPVQVEEAVVTPVLPPPTTTTQDDTRTNLADIDRNVDQAPLHWWQKYPLLRTVDKQDFYCSILIVVLVIITIVCVGVTLGIKHSDSAEVVVVDPATAAPHPLAALTPKSPNPSSTPSLSANPSASPSQSPSSFPTVSTKPSTEPTLSPSSAPSVSTAPSKIPTNAPSSVPSLSIMPSASPTESSAPSWHPSNVPTFDVSAIRESIASLLPNLTVQAIQNDRGAPQAKALAFAAMDGAINSDYPFWRILQRFALATFYFSTNGDEWTKRQHWLDHEMSECQWFLSQSGLGCYPYVQEARYKRLILRDNNLVGTLPRELFLFLRDLQMIDISGNSITGSLPTEIGLLTNLEELNAHENALTGQLPTQIGLVPNLSELFVSFNQLTGGIPSQVGNLRRLELLRLYQNSLGDTLPTQLGQCRQLKGIFLFGNQLEGSIPSELGSLALLETLSLPLNNLGSSIPSELGHLRNVEFLRLSGNQLTGTLPTDLVTLWALKKIDVVDNAGLSGEIPGGLCSVIAFDCTDSLCGCDCDCAA